MVLTGREAENAAFPLFPIFLYCCISDTSIADLEAGIGEARSLDNDEHSGSGGSCW